VYCVRCGSAIPAGDKFCRKCGAGVDQAAGDPRGVQPAPAAAPARVQPAVAPPAAGHHQAHPAHPVVKVNLPAAQSVLRNKAVLIGALAVVVAVVGVVVYNLWPSGGVGGGVNRPTGTQANYPSNTPEGPWPGDTDPTLVQRQQFGFEFDNENGTAYMNNVIWTNTTGYKMASAVVQCNQNNSDSILLSKTDVILSGPMPAYATNTYSMVKVGPVAANMYTINCFLVSVSQQ